MAAPPAILSLHDAPETYGGSEADIFRVRESDRYLVKLFRQELPQDRDQLVRGLCRLSGQGPVAWPCDVRRFKARPGLVLPRVAGCEIHALTSRATRLENFPGSSWDLVIKAARNYAAACAAVHALGLAVVDISSRNALVDPKGRVTLIDADSFLLPGGLARVATEEYQSPETCGKLPLAWQIEYDLHGIALIIFELLFQKAWPWRQDGPRTTFRYEWRSRAGLNDWEIGLADVSPDVAQFFVRAFGIKPNRPTAAEWVRALDAMVKMVRHCPKVAAHAFVAGDGRTCPWCACAARPGGQDVFRLDDSPQCKARSSEPAPATSPNTAAVPQRTAGYLARPKMSAWKAGAGFVFALAAVWHFGFSTQGIGHDLSVFAEKASYRAEGIVLGEDVRDWRRARSGDFTTVDRYAGTYPSSRYADDAQTRLVELATLLPVEPVTGARAARTVVRLREAPTTNARQMGKLLPGRRIRPLGTVLGGTWYVAEFGGERVFVAGEWMKKPSTRRRKFRRTRQYRSGALERPAREVMAVAATASAPYFAAFAFADRYACQRRSML